MVAYFVANFGIGVETQTHWFLQRGEGVPALDFACVSSLSLSLAQWEPSPISHIDSPQGLVLSLSSPPHSSLSLT